MPKPTDSDLVRTLMEVLRWNAEDAKGMLADLKKHDAIRYHDNGGMTFEFDKVIDAVSKGK